jgi:AcrR family transcriptional regulator
MKDMSTDYVRSGRIGQKQRTLDALVAAAREIVASGETPTVERVAEVADISRATAYRYFPNQQLLLAAAHPETGATTMLPADPPDDPAARLDLVVDAFTRMIADTEAQQRTMLRLSLEPDPAKRAELPLRQGRAIGWIEEALEPLRGDLSDAELRRVVLAIRSATGIEALAWLTDIGGLSTKDARSLMRWSAQAMLRQALEAGPPPVAGRRSTRRTGVR